MSACIFSLYSSDQRAPGFESVLRRGCGSGGVLLSLGDLRTPVFSLSVTRGDLGLGDGFELFMQLYVAPVWVYCAAAPAVARLSAAYKSSDMTAIYQRSLAKCDDFAHEYTPAE
jgi:hypothetical protein